MARVSPVFAPALALALFLGFIDAQAFLATGGFFAAFMSGNTTRLATGFAGHDWNELKFGLAIVLSFLVGCILAEVAARAQPRGREWPGLAVSAVLLAVAALLASYAPPRFGPLPLVAAMGALHTAARSGAAGSVHPGYPSEALVRLGQGLADALIGVAPRTAWLPHLLIWAGFALGAALGAMAYMREARDALWFAALAVVAFALWARLRRDSRPNG